MKLALRNWLAERCLEALREPTGEPVVRALAEFARQADGSGEAGKLAPAQRALLLGEGSPFEPLAGGIRLRGDLMTDLAAIRERVAMFLDALHACRARCGRFAKDGEEEATEFALCAAAALFNAGLFFETHEILEPPWKTAGEPLRTLLQGIIQVAAGFHHRDNGNLRGAHALLREGVARLHPFAPAAYGVEIESFLADVDAVGRTLGADAAPRADPRLVYSPVRTR